MSHCSVIVSPSHLIQGSESGLLMEIIGIAATAHSATRNSPLESIHNTQRVHVKLVCLHRERDDCVPSFSSIKLDTFQSGSNFGFFDRFVFFLSRSNSATFRREILGSERSLICNHL